MALTAVWRCVAISHVSCSMVKTGSLRLSAIEDSIVFIDEGNAFVVSNNFARAIKNTSNYYVIAVREALPALPYSVDEIYGIRNMTARRQKYLPVVRVYSSFFRLYGSNAMHGVAMPDYVVVEDSNSGFDFFEALCGKAGIPCVSAVGKSNIYDAVRRADAESVLVVADGAAFGPEMEKVLSLGHAKHVSLFLPESFEWLILKSGLIEPDQVAEILDDPADFIESRDYFSWERFFTACLTALSKEGHLRYSKAHLNPNYLNDKEFKAIACAAEREGLPAMWEIR